jgi:lipopolysaccharide cholinephosphotransferase
MKDYQCPDKVITGKEQKALLIELLDYVHNFCLAHNIKYSLCGGTLLGAIRHKGFIPWDDDIDIQLLRDDYNRLIEDWNKESHPYIFHNIESGNTQYAYGKISNPKTIVKDGNNWLMGVNIDVFPIDKVIDIDDFRRRHAAVMKRYVYLWRIMRPFKWNVKIIFWKIIRMFKNEQDIIREIDNIAKSNNDRESDYVFEMVAGRLYKEPCPSKVFEEMIQVEFENKKYFAVKGYDQYLSSCYGNYMQLPPKEKRVSHHSIEAYWKY